MSEMVTVISRKVVVSRKPSTCFGCGLMYPAGTRMERVAQVVSTPRCGGLETTSYCPTCLRYLAEYMDMSDTIDFGELRLEDPEGWEKIRQTQ